MSDLVTVVVKCSILTVDVRKTYGAIPGVPIGSWWETRYVNSSETHVHIAHLYESEACSKDAIHA